MTVIFGKDGCLTGNKGIYTLANSSNNLHANVSKLNQFTTNIEFSFNNFTSSITSNKNIIDIPNKDTNTINFNGDIYKLHNIQHCIATSVQDPSMSEVYFTFYNNSNQSPYLIILSYLIRHVAVGETHNNFISEMVHPPVIPTSTNKSILDFTRASSDHYAYHTCIPCNIKDGDKIIKNGSIKALCFVGSTIFSAVKSDIKVLLLKKYKYINPVNGYDITMTDDAGIISSDNTLYNNRILFESSGDTIDTLLFLRYTYKDNKGRAPIKESKRIDQLKCFSVKEKRDINGNILLIDPATGKTLKEYIDYSEKTSGIPPTPSNNVNAFVKILGIIFGVLGLVIIISLLIWLFYKKDTISVDTSIPIITTASSS